MDNQVEFLQLDLLKEIIDTNTKTDKMNKKVDTIVARLGGSTHYVIFYLK